MKIQFSLSFDDGPWRSFPNGASAIFAAARLGPQGLLGLLEAQLGLTRPVPTRSHRVAALVPRVLAIDGFWSKSAQLDPFASADCLLRWRDELRLAGWDGQPLTPRLAAIGEVTAHDTDGFADRLERIVDAIDDQAIDIESVEVIGDELDDMPAQWRRTLTALEEAGVSVDWSKPAAAEASGDLSSALEQGFAPSGDGSLQLLRAAGPVTAAEQVAAWLDAQGDTDTTVIIGADEILDEALRARGLPTTGAAGPSRSNAALDVLPATLQMAWCPQDPRLALELLLMRHSPIPHSIAWRLIRALGDWPAVDSDDWRAAIREGLCGIEDEDRRTRVEQRLSILFDAAVESDRYPVSEIQRRVDMLLAWLGGRRESAADWESAVAQCDNLLRLTEVCELDALTPMQLNRLVEMATADAQVTSRYQAKAGLHCARRPQAIVDPARRVIWWNFVRDAAESVRQIPLSPQDRSALREAGVELPDPGHRAEQLARQWRTPFRMTRESLVLVCPQTGADGEEDHPHPIWDEISAGFTPAQAALVEVSEPLGVGRDHTLDALPAPVRPVIWQLQGDRSIAPPDHLSPTSLIRLLGCPIHWVLERVGKIRRGRTGPLPSNALLRGSLAHGLLEVLLNSYREGERLSPVEAGEAAGQLFDERAPRLAAEYFVAGAEGLKAQVRGDIVHAAQELFRVIGDAKATVFSIEQTFENQIAGVTLSGIPDLALSQPEAVLDLKNGGFGYRHDEMTSGTAVQLACYTHLLTDHLKDPAIGYFIINRAQLLIDREGCLPHGEVAEGPRPREVWSATERAVAVRLQQLGAGQVIAGCAAEGDQKPPDKSSLVEGELILTPPCNFCDYQAICGGGCG